jgi:hypothetical protein
MQAYRIDRFGSVDGIVLRSSEGPRPGLKEVLMRVRASSLNYRDLMVVKGGGRGPTKIGVVPLSDGAGEVAAIGEGVTRVKISERIAGCFHQRWFGGPIKPDYLTDRLGANLDGMLAEYAVFNEEAVVHLPSQLSFEEAATLPCAAVTAWVALTGHRRVTAGDTVLIQGSGGVSVFALQFARVLGARLIATTSTAEKAKRLKALGASDVINYTETPDWDAKVLDQPFHQAVGPGELDIPAVRGLGGSLLYCKWRLHHRKMHLSDAHQIKGSGDQAGRHRPSTAQQVAELSAGNGRRNGKITLGFKRDKPIWLASISPVADERDVARPSYVLPAASVHFDKEDET